MKISSWWKQRKTRKDKERAHRIITLLREMENIRRKDFVLDTVLHMNYTVEELVEFSNLLGRVAHERNRHEET